MKGTTWGNILLGVGAALLLLVVIAADIFGGGPPNRVTLTAAGRGVQVEGSHITFELNPLTGKYEMSPLYKVKDVDVVIHGDVNAYGAMYHEGDRLTSKEGKLVHQNPYQRARNDLRYWAFCVRGKC